MFESGLRTMNKSIKVNGRLFCTLNPRYTRFTISTIDRLALAPKFQLTQQGYPANYVPPTAPLNPPSQNVSLLANGWYFPPEHRF